MVEVVISLLLLTIAWIAAIDALIVSKYAAPCSRNRFQAIYLAQKTLEEQRRIPFSNIQNYAIQNYSTSNTFGLFTPDNNCPPMALTITVARIDDYTERVQVRLAWTEHFYGYSVAAAEYCTTDIANESQLN